ncbi:MAG: hypothetical protein HY226_05930 [Candidatus Vogelbacteria bacterium]|nr:hypothetical protein [Candidatus Vogelbacteria bacterium]
MEKLKSSETNEQERLNKIADELDRLQRQKNKGKPVSYVDWIVKDLRGGNLHGAQVNYINQSDKYTDLPEILAVLKREKIAEETVHEKFKRLKKDDQDLDFGEFLEKELAERNKARKEK